MSYRNRLNPPKFDVHVHRRSGGLRFADRVKALYSLEIHGPCSQFARAFMDGRETVPALHRQARDGSLAGPARHEAGGGEPKLHCSHRPPLAVKNVIGCRNLVAFIHCCETFNDQSTIAVFPRIGARFTGVQRAEFYVRNARFHAAQSIKDYLKRSRIEWVFLPPSAPNLSWILGYKDSFRKIVVFLFGRNNKTFRRFKTAHDGFFARLDCHHALLARMIVYFRISVNKEHPDLPDGRYNRRLLLIREPRY